MDNDETARILRWLDELAAIHAENMAMKGLKVASKHHRNACLWIAQGIRSGEHLYVGR